MNDWQKRNAPIIQEFRANGGKVKGYKQLILLTTIGAKTGNPHIFPLMYVPHEEYIVAVASKGGSADHPAWYYNLLANPQVTVEVGSQVFEANARVLTDQERERAFARAVEVFPYYAQYQKKTAREIPVIALQRLHPQG